MDDGKKKKDAFLSGGLHKILKAGLHKVIMRNRCYFSIKTVCNSGHHKTVKINEKTLKCKIKRQNI